jgi:hypothetical protein
MAIELKKCNNGRVLEVEVIGRLTPRAYRSFELEFMRFIRQHRKLRVHFEMVSSRK